MAQLGTYSSDGLIRFIEAAGERANIDAKGPMEWDGGEASAVISSPIRTWTTSPFWSVSSNLQLLQVSPHHPTNKNFDRLA